MGYSQTRKDEVADKQEGGCTKDSIHAYTNVVANPCILATELNKPLIHRDNSLKKVNLAFKLIISADKKKINRWPRIV